MVIYNNGKKYKGSDNFKLGIIRMIKINKFSTNKNKIFFTVMVLAFSGCSRNEPPADVEYKRAPKIHHIVAPGDSIASIARDYDMDRELLIELNQLELPYRLVVGQKLIIAPSSAGPKKQNALAEGPIDVDSYEDQIEDQDSLSPPKFTPSVNESPAVDQEEISQPVVTIPDQQELVDPEEPVKPKVDKTNKALKTGGYQWPLRGQIIKTFGSNGKGQKPHDGINILAPRGTPVKAASSGQVVHASNQARGFGNVILIKHDDGHLSAYAHLNEINVKKDDIVKQGQKIGTVGNTGNVKQTQLHFEIRKGTKPIDPKILLPKE